MADSRQQTAGSRQQTAGSRCVTLYLLSSFYLNSQSLVGCESNPGTARILALTCETRRVETQTAPRPRSAPLRSRSVLQNCYNSPSSSFPVFPVPDPRCSPVPGRGSRWSRRFPRLAVPAVPARRSQWVDSRNSSDIDWAANKIVPLSPY